MPPIRLTAANSARTHVKSQTRREFLKTTGAAVGLAALNGCGLWSHLDESNDTTLPNIVVIWADDLGQREISCYGGDIPTPNIDSIARTGARFTDFYAANPTCAPSRYSFLTGQHHNRTYQTNTPGRTTLPQALKARGYLNAIIGKWHMNPIGPKSPQDLETARQLGMPNANLTWTPTEHGFDYYCGHWYPTYFCHDRDVTIWRRLLSSDFNLKPWFTATGQLDPPTGYATDILTEDAAAFIRSVPQDRPFFLWLPYNAPHYGHGIVSGKDNLANNHANTCWITPNGGTPHPGRSSGADIRTSNTLAAKPQDLDIFKHTKNRKRRFFQAMVKSMDDDVGVILKTLKETGRLNNTIVIFTSDQGSDETPSSAGRNHPFRGAKHSQWEGGLRVPFVMQWPRRMRAGRVIAQIGSHIDMLPTFCGITDIKTEDLLVDGIDITAAILQDQHVQRDLFWYESHPAITPHRVFRRGSWKLADDELYHLDEDIRETTNLAHKYPDKFQELKQAHQAILSKLPCPG